MDTVVIGNPAVDARRRQGLLLASLGAIGFSGKAIIVKLAYRHGVDAVTLLTYRMLFSLPLFLALGWWSGRGKPRLTGRDIAVVLGLGFLGYYLSSFLDFAGLKYVSASLERLILYLNPTLVLALSVFAFGKTVTRAQVIALAVSYAGVVCVFGHELSLRGANVPLGASLVFCSTISYALYLTLSGQEVRRLGALRPHRPRDQRRMHHLHRSVPGAAAHFSPGCAARRDLALGPELNCLHLCTGSHGDDGSGEDRRRDGGTGGHNRSCFDNSDGRGFTG